MDLSIYLCKEGTAEPDLLSSNAVAPTRFEENGYVLLVYRKEDKRPNWLELCETSLGQALPIAARGPDLRALLYFSIQGRFFLVPFGMGARFLFDQDVVERDFGLRVVANLADSKSLRAIDFIGHDVVRFRTRQQAGRSTSLRSFALDEDREFVNALAGSPVGKEISGFSVTRFAGSDALRLPWKRGQTDLQGFCETLIPHYQSNDYASRYRALGKVQLVKDPVRLLALDAQLQTSVLNGEVELDFSPPGSLDELQSYSYSLRQGGGRGQIDPEECVANLRSELDSALDLKSQLKGYKLHRAEEEGYALTHLYNAVAAEIKLKQSDEMYVLSEGAWYRVAPDYLRALNTFVDEIPGFGDYRMFDFVDENDFNPKFAALHGGVELHKANVAPKGQDQVEPCDVLCSGPRFVHIKVGTTSGSLSHLLAQAHSSFELLMSDAGSWTKLHRLAPAMVSQDRVPASQVTICLQVLSRRKRDPFGMRISSSSLPFFSRLNIKRNVRQIRLFQAKVTLDVIGTSK